MTLAATVAAITAAWSDDPQSGVLWAGDHGDGASTSATDRCDFTTVWFEVSDHTSPAKQASLPEPRFHHLRDYRQCLARNTGLRRIHFALDGEARSCSSAGFPSEVTPHELGLVLGESGT